MAKQPFTTQDDSQVWFTPEQVNYLLKLFPDGSQHEAVHGDLPSIRLEAGKQEVIRKIIERCPTWRSRQR